MIFKIFLLLIFVLIGRPQDLLTALQPLRPAFILTIITFSLVILTTNKTQLAHVFEAKESRLYALFYIIMIFGIPFAYNKRIAFDFIFLSYLPNVIFFFLFITMVDSLKRIKSVLTVILCCTLFYSVLGLITGSLIGGRFFTYGSMFDPNDIAYVLISIFPLSIFYIVYDDGLIKKIAAMISIAAATSVILLTGSRAGLIALVVVLFLLLFMKNDVIKRFYKIISMICVLVLVFIYSDKINIDRFRSITDMGSDYNVTSESGRLAVWEKASFLLQENPMTGVGVASFPFAIGYLREDLNLAPMWQVTHNSYLQVAVEMGILGFITFMSLVYISLKTFYSYKINEYVKEKESIIISYLLVVGFAGSLISAFFISQGYSLIFILFFAFSVALKKMEFKTV